MGSTLIVAITVIVVMAIPLLVKINQKKIAMSNLELTQTLLYLATLIIVLLVLVLIAIDTHPSMTEYNEVYSKMTEYKQYKAKYEQFQIKNIEQQNTIKQLTEQNAEIPSLKKVAKENEEKIQTLTTTTDEMQKNINDANDNITSLEQIKTENTAEIGKLKGEVADIQFEKEQCEHERAILDNDKNALDTKVNDNDDLYTDLLESNEKIEDELNTCKESLKQCNNKKSWF
eukprot:465235_1